MYARLCSATGWTWEYVGECVTMQRLYAFLDFWREAPPVAESVAAYLGIKPAVPAGAVGKPQPRVDDEKRIAFMNNAPLRIVKVPR